MIPERIIFVSRGITVLVFFCAHVHILTAKHADRNVYWTTSLSFPLLISRQNNAPVCRSFFRTRQFHSQEITIVWWNPNVHYRIHNSSLFVPVKNQMNAVQAIPYYFFKIILPSMPRRFLWSLYFGYPHQNLVTVFLFHGCHVCRLTHFPLIWSVKISKHHNWYWRQIYTGCW